MHRKPLNNKGLFNGKLCAVVAASDARKAWRQIEIGLRNATVLELRLDWLKNDREIEKFLAKLAARRKTKATLLATCRRVEAGGKYTGPIAKQLSILDTAAQAGCRWFDLEIETIRACSSELLKTLRSNARQLTSAHYFD